MAVANSALRYLWWLHNTQNHHSLAAQTVANNRSKKQQAGTGEIRVAIHVDANQDEFQQPMDELTAEQSSNLDRHSAPFVGQWNQLISTTNWDKGRIIVDWQESMRSSELPASAYNDQRWCQLVGGATPQHVGRLRRTYVRFGHVYGEYEGLYWSHFYAALDWDDAEMWLEGAVQNGWSVSEMRTNRWETLGKVPKDRPRIDQIVVTELEEETRAIGGRVFANDREIIEGPILEGPDFGDEDHPTRRGNRQTTEALDAELKPRGPKLKPFESFTDLPDDVSAAACSFKIAIIRHKADRWSEISLDDLLGLLEALKQLAKANPE